MLLVEDNQLNAEIAAELLKMSGLTVDCAWDGYDATRAIRSSARDYCNRVPIVAMTANAFAEDVQAAKTVGMNEHIAKPLDLGGGDARCLSRTRSPLPGRHFRSRFLPKRYNGVVFHRSPLLRRSLPHISKA